MAVVAPFEYNKTLPIGTELQVIGDLVRELHMRIQTVYASVSTIGNAAAIEADTTQLGLVDEADGATGTALLDWLYAIDAAIGSGMSDADAVKAFAGKIVEIP